MHAKQKYLVMRVLSRGTTPLPSSHDPLQFPNKTWGMQFIGQMMEPRLYGPGMEEPEIH